MTGLIVALDNPNLDEAADLARNLEPAVSAFKVGLTLFVAHGPDAVARIGKYGPVFCDLKLHDIPHQVRLAAKQLADLGVWMFTVHAGGGPAMVSAAVEGAGSSTLSPIVAAVTVLTSMRGSDLDSIGVGSPPVEQVARLADLARGAGAGALVCSAQETALLRRRLGDSVLLVTPGIRPAGSSVGDQARVMTPEGAVQAGSSYVVVGRPITGADDPVRAAESVAEALAGGK